MIVSENHRSAAGIREPSPGNPSRCQAVVLAHEPDLEESTLNQERRQERRYPLVGIAVLYSPTEGKYLADTGRRLCEAAAVDMSLSGLSFDVREPLAPGEEILIELDDPEGGQGERILAEVRWCRRVDDAHFRIGTRIRESMAVERRAAREDIVGRPIGKGLPVPTEVDLRCPACGVQAAFTLLGLQPGAWEHGVMPLYQCGSCDSSRSITSILAYNRDRAR